MFYNIGQQVVLRYTGDVGKVEAIHSDGMIMVALLDEDLVVPVYEEDLVLPKDYAPIEKINKKPAATDAEPFPIATQYSILQSKGFQLAFEEVRKHDDIEKYKIFLVNDTHEEAIFVFKLKIEDEILLEVDGKADSMSVLSLGELFFEELNDHPIADFEFCRITTAGLEEVIHKSLKIKPQQFFKNIITVPLLNKRAHHFVIAATLVVEEKQSAPTEENLQTYTKRAMKPRATISAPVDPTQSTPYRSKNDLQALANFVPEIDLHIEKLTQDHRGLSNSQIITIQLAHFERFMQQAIRLGVDRVYVIHGIGKGKLRDAITTKLMQEFDFQTFKNEYHPRYGFGATEIIL
jgi:hypothetical protein